MEASTHYFVTKLATYDERWYENTLNVVNQLLDQFLKIGLNWSVKNVNNIIVYISKGNWEVVRIGIL